MNFLLSIRSPDDGHFAVGRAFAVLPDGDDEVYAGGYETPVHVDLVAGDPGFESSQPRAGYALILRVPEGVPS